MPIGPQILQSTRLTGMIQALEDVRLLPQALKFSARVPEVPSWDGEILARDISRVQIADLIADDQRAAVYSTGKLTFETTLIPNLKVGIHFTQEQLNQLQMINALGGVPAVPADSSNLYQGTVEGIMRDRVNRLELGIQQRKEQLIIGMMLDTLSYDRLGIKVTGSWGMPTDLKTTVTTTWDNAGAADPIADILTKLRYAKVRYGENYNRLTMSTQAFIYMTATTAFQNRAKSVLLQYGATTATLPFQSMPDMAKVVESLTGMQIELYDARYWQQQTDGGMQSFNLFPINVVLFSNTSDDGNASAMNVANSIVTESVVSSLVGGPLGSSIGNLGGVQRGPVSWAEGELNPPNITLWSVKRCWPRKVRLTASSTLTVGTAGTAAWTDSIPVGEPF